MITGNVRKEITKGAILNLISEWDIYRLYLGDFKLGRAFCNKLRDEDNPSLIVRNIDGKLFHKDYGNYYYRGDCWNLVCQKYGCDFSAALKHIERDFNLGISDGNIVPGNQTIITWEQPKREIIPPPLIQIVTRKWQNNELAYWNEYHQDISDLKRENIYVPKTIYRNRSKLPLKKGELVFCYWYPDEEHWVIYRPLSAKKTKITPVWEYKWDKNLSYKYVENLSGLNKCDIAFITKSKKDRMVLMKALQTNCICNVQAEDPAVFSDEVLQYIKDNSNRQVVNSDNDKTGKEFSWWLTTEHNYKHCNVPDKYKDEGITDFADLARSYGLQMVFDHFRNKGFI